MSEASVIDFSGLDAAASASTSTTDSAAVETPTTDTTSTEVTTQDANADAPAKGAEADASKGSDGSAKAAEETGSISKPAPGQITKALQAYKDASPENADMAKMLNNIARREFEYSKEFGSVTEARAVSSLLREVAGVSEGQPLTATAAREAIAGLQGTVTAAQESDALLYEGSKTLIDNVVSDLTTQGKLEALGKLLTPFVEATREHDPAGFVAHQRSLFLQTAHETGMSETLNAAYAALSKGDSATAMSKLRSIGSYFNELQKAETDKAREAEIVKRETAKLTTEKSTQASAERTQFQTTVAKTCESHNNKLLGAELGPYLKQAYFKGWGRENLMPLGNTLKQNLYAALKQDQSYQAAMKKMWAAPKPDQSTIEAYHKAAVLKLAKATVEKTIKVMYPNYKPSATAAAGRVDAAKAKAAPAVKETPVGRNNRSLGTAEYVTTKPTNLIHGKDWELLMIAGKGFVPDGKGGSKLITWRRT